MRAISTLDALSWFSRAKGHRGDCNEFHRLKNKRPRNGTLEGSHELLSYQERLSLNLVRKDFTQMYDISEESITVTMADGQIFHQDHPQLHSVNIYGDKVQSCEQGAVFKKAYPPTEIIATPQAYGNKKQHLKRICQAPTDDAIR